MGTEHNLVEVRGDVSRSLSRVMLACVLACGWSCTHRFLVNASAAVVNISAAAWRSWVQTCELGEPDSDA